MKIEKHPMMRRFSLYGFLKNQRYFEPFLYLIFLEKGLSFFQIGVLVSIREVTVVLTEVPSGAVADVYGRRRSMILSFTAYIASFLVFAMAGHVMALGAAMVLFGIGDSFRTGTHKAMIFSWLSLQGQERERTRFYGHTRSWSKYGSAVSTIIATVLVVTSNSYTFVFYAAIVPYVLGIINFLGYPAAVDGQRMRESDAVRHLWRTVKDSLRSSALRRLYLESMSYEGVFHAVKDYIQPVIMALAVGAASSVAIAKAFSETQLTALAVAPVYVLLYALSGLASRRAHRVADRYASEDDAARTLWWVTAAIYAGLTITAYFNVSALVIVTFVALNVMQNFWRPILISRFDHHGGELQGATLLSTESQARRIGTVVVAPIIGWAVDYTTSQHWGGDFWPVGLAGVIAAVFFLRRRQGSLSD
jgi:MFS family permease